MRSDLDQRASLILGDGAAALVTAVDWTRCDDRSILPMGGAGVAILAPEEFDGISTALNSPGAASSIPNDFRTALTGSGTCE